MSSKIRLLADFSIQFLLLIIFGGLSYERVDKVWVWASTFVLIINLWQILYAFYMIKQHNSWEKLVYLKQIKLIISYAIFSCFVSGAIYGLSWGLLAGFAIFMCQVFWVLFGLILLFFGLYQFILSVKQLYLGFQRSYSFWDIK